MENYLNENFGGVKPKNSSEEALIRWRKLCSVVKNRKRRFRFTANLPKRSEAEDMKRSNQVFNEISSREMEGLNVFHGVLSNWVFMAVMSFTVVFQVILIEFLGSFASTIPLSQTQWFLSVLIGFLGMPVAMLVKLIPLSGESNGYKLKVE